MEKQDFKTMYDEVKTYRKVRRVTKKDGKEMIVCSITQEFWLPVSYFEKVMYNADKINKVVEEQVSYREQARVYPTMKGQRKY